MPRERDPRRDQAFEIWKEKRGEIDLVEIANQLGVSPGTVRGWKSKDDWEQKLSETLRNEWSATKGTERSKPNSEMNKPEQSAEIEKDDLTEKQRLFVLEYLRDFNATRAAMAVGYSKKTAYSIGWELLRKPEIQAEIKRIKGLMANELGLDVKRVIAELMKIAFADISDVSEFGQMDEPIFDAEGNLIVNPATGEPMTIKRNFVALKNANEIDSSVISEVKQGKGGVISVKMHDKLRALEKLERYLDFMTEEEKLKLDKLRADIQAAEMRAF